MNIFKKIGAAALAVAAATSCLAAPASAETKELKLLTSPISVDSVRDNLALTDGKIIGIDVEKWQKTGEFAYSTVKTDFEIPENYSWWLNADRKYGYFVEPSETTNSLRVFKYDEKAKKISTVKNYGTDWANVSNKSYVISRKADDTAKTFSITVSFPDGKSKTHSFAYKGKGDYYWDYSGVNSDKYVACVLWKTDEKEEIYGESKTTYYSYDIYGITKDGELETLYSETGDSEMYVISFGPLVGGENCVSWKEYRRPFAQRTCIYDLNTGKTFYGARSLDNYEFDSAVMCRYTDGYSSSRIDGTDLFGDRFIAACPVDFTTRPYEYRYVLFQIVNSEMQNYTNLTNVYKSMSTEDGKIFLVQTVDDKWGYINANGKELALFDDAGSFVGDYAPVIKNGKAYLIDKNMNCVSEKIDADRVKTINSDMFTCEKDGKTYLVTFAAPSEPTSEPTTSEPTSEPTSSEPTSETSGSTGGSDAQNPNTGAAGIGFAVGLTALGAAAVVLSRKKK